MHIIKWVTNMNVHTHNVSIIDRNVVNITGVNKIESFDNEEFLLETVMGFIDIKGEELEIVKLDTMEGNVSIKGKLNSLVYIENIKKKNKEEGVISKLFK